MDIPLEILDTEVSLAAATLDRAQALDAHRRVSSRATYHELAARQGLLVAPLRDWVHALTLARVLAPDVARLDAAWCTAAIPIEEPGIPAFVASPRDLILRLLGDREPVRRRAFALALPRAAGAVEAARRLAERRAEATRLLGGDADAHEIPCDPPDGLASLAERLLIDTATLVDATHGAWFERIEDMVARRCSEGWPARLGPRWIFDLFGRGPLTEGLRLELAPLPAAFGASSFARALGAFGAALAAADGPSTGPFVLSRAPFDLRRHRRAALFAGLAADPVFAVRTLGLGRGRALDQTRDVARALLLSLRLDATRVLCRGLLARPDGPSLARFEERTAAALGAPLPRELAGLVPRLGPQDPARLAGALLAAADRRVLVDRFDEDWFRNPQAARALREEDAVPPASLRTSVAMLEAGLAEVMRVLER